MNRKKFVKFNKNALLKIVGVYSSSKVYAAIYTETDLYYTLKVMRISPSNMPQIQQEVKMMNKTIHPSIIKFKEVLYYKEKSKIFFIMEYSDLGSLARLIAQGVKYIESQICSIFKQVVDSISYLH